MTTLSRFGHRGSLRQVKDARIAGAWILQPRPSIMRNRLVLALPSLLAVAACGSSAGGVGSDAASDHRADDVDANTDAKPQADCGAVALLPPIVEVVDAVTGTPICDPVFMVD